MCAYHTACVTLHVCRTVFQTAFVCVSNCASNCVSRCIYVEKCVSNWVSDYKCIKMRVCGGASHLVCPHASRGCVLTDGAYWGCAVTGGRSWQRSLSGTRQNDYQTSDRFVQKHHLDVRSNCLCVYAVADSFFVFSFFVLCGRICVCCRRLFLCVLICTCAALSLSCVCRTVKVFTICVSAGCCVAMMCQIVCANNCQ